MSLRRVMPLLAALCAVAALGAHAPARAQAEGTDYRLLASPQPTATPGKIEVIEFFSYACPHCAEFYPLISAWVATAPKDVAFRRVPVGFDRPVWINLQRAYFSLQASGDLDRLDGKLFHAIHQEGLQLFDGPSLAEWVSKNGGEADKFISAYTSFGVNSLTVQADKMVQDYEVDSVPKLVVEGKYVILGDSFSEIIANTDKVVAKVRAARGAAMPKKK